MSEPFDKERYQREIRENSQRINIAAARCQAIYILSGSRTQANDCGYTSCEYSRTCDLHDDPRRQPRKSAVLMGFRSVISAYIETPYNPFSGLTDYVASGEMAELYEIGRQIGKRHERDTEAYVQQYEESGGR